MSASIELDANINNREQRAQFTNTIEELGRDDADYHMSYQITVNIADSREAANKSISEYINLYYPELSKVMDLDEWGSVDTPEGIIGWIKTFYDAGAHYFFAAAPDREERRGGRGIINFQTAGPIGRRHDPNCIRADFLQVFQVCPARTTGYWRRVSKEVRMTRV